MQISIIGINGETTEFSSEVMKIIQKGKNFAGGKRHKNIISELLPGESNWFDIVAPLDRLFEKISKMPNNWVVFASGDPLFFGIGNTLKQQFPKATITVYPTFNSLQLLAHRFKLAYGNFRTISLTGREWHEFDKALIQGVDKMGVLTDRNKTPKIIAERMLHYNYNNYIIYYGEHMGSKQEKVKKLSLREALTFKAQHPNCLFLEKTNRYMPQKGISERDFITLPNRPNMITKLPIRITTLAYMELHSKKVLWDIGACTGSMSVDAKLHYPHLAIHAFEVRNEATEIINKNSQRFQTPGITIHPGDFLHVEKEELHSPDCVFLGGHNNQIEAILKEIDQYLLPQSIIAFNAVKESNSQRFAKWCKASLYHLKQTHTITVNEHNKVKLLIAQKS